jgi:hypothetical protein
MPTAAPLKTCCAGLRAASKKPGQRHPRVRAGRSPTAPPKPGRARPGKRNPKSACAERCHPQRAAKLRGRRGPGRTWPGSRRPRRLEAVQVRSELRDPMRTALSAVAGSSVAPRKRASSEMLLRRSDWTRFEPVDPAEPRVARVRRRALAARSIESPASGLPVRQECGRPGRRVRCRQQFRVGRAEDLCYPAPLLQLHARSATGHPTCFASGQRASSSRIRATSSGASRAAKWPVSRSTMSRAPGTSPSVGRRTCWRGREGWRSRQGPTRSTLARAARTSPQPFISLSSALG